jgi:hypothetical protein
MTWSWRFETTDGTVVDGVTTEKFPSQADAESWIGESWQEVAETGVDQVVLLEGDREVYGPMSLHAAD